MPLSPPCKMPLITRPPGGGIFLGISIGVGPFHIRIPCHLPVPRHPVRHRPRRALGQPTKHTRPRTLQRQGRRERVAFRPCDRLMAIGAAPTIVSLPSRRRTEQHIWGSRRTFRRPDQDDMVFFHHLPGPFGPKGDNIPSGPPIRTHFEPISHRPSAPNRQGRLWRLVMLSSELRGSQNNLIGLPIPPDLKIPTLRRGRNMEIHRLSGA